MSLPAYDSPITRQALRLSENPVKETRWEASMKTKRKLLLSSRGRDWNWPGVETGY